MDSSKKASMLFNLDEEGGSVTFRIKDDNAEEEYAAHKSASRNDSSFRSINSNNNNVVE